MEIIERLVSSTEKGVIVVAAMLVTECLYIVSIEKRDTHSSATRMSLSPRYGEEIDTLPQV